MKTRRVKRLFLMLASSLMMVWMLTSCFSVDSTKKIKLSKEDTKILLPSEEETFISEISGIALVQWQLGKSFQALDDRAELIFETMADSFGNSTSKALKGQTLVYKGIEQRLMPDKSLVAVVVFENNGRQYRYVTGKNPEQALKEVKSDDIPMILDIDIIDATRRLLEGRRLWTRTPLWYDSEDKPIAGRRYVPVEITSIEAGDMVFPLRVGFIVESGETYYVKMNIGHGNAGSREFSSLFLLKDNRPLYSRIDDDVWRHIQNSEVEEGMTKEECRLSLGNPPESMSGHDYSQAHDIWRYNDGTTLIFRDGILYQKIKDIPKESR